VNPFIKFVQTFHRVATLHALQDLQPAFDGTVGITIDDCPAGARQFFPLVAWNAVPPQAGAYGIDEGQPVAVI
jgi:hypothetical protein